MPGTFWEMTKSERTIRFRMLQRHDKTTPFKIIERWATGRGHEDDERRLIHSTCLCVVLVSFPHETSSTTLDG
jgi:hypothetical protein